MKAEYKDIPSRPAKLSEVARVIRSKNLGPFELTFDVIFDSVEAYQRVKTTNLLTKKTMQDLYNLSESDVLVSMFFDLALAWKCTIKTPWA